MPGPLLFVTVGAVSGDSRRFAMETAVYGWFDLGLGDCQSVEK